MENVVISNPKKIKEIYDRIISEGSEKFHVLADFDRTLTKAFSHERKTPSVISILRDGDYISEDYAKKST